MREMQEHPFQGIAPVCQLKCHRPDVLWRNIVRGHKRDSTWPDTDDPSKVYNLPKSPSFPDQPELVILF